MRPVHFRDPLSRLLATLWLLLSFAGNAWAAGWIGAAGMSTARSYHSATLLPDGRLLAAGGWNGSSVLSGTELFDPATNRWLPAGNLATARLSHTATLLRSGKVLVVGGSGNAGDLASAELYDPATNAWSPAGGLATPRYGHSATRLADGRILVAGGWSGYGALGSAELYDPATNAWTPAGNLAVPRDVHTATLLADGRVLVAGGRGSSGYLSSVERYDPVTNAWSPAGALSAIRGYHSATRLPDGRVLVAAGYNTTIGFLGGAELYNPATDTWAAAGNHVSGRSYHSATLLPDGSVLAVGGWSGSGFSSQASAERYNPATNTWSAVGSLASARRDHSATLLPDGTLLVAGGQDAAGSMASVERYDSATHAWLATGGLAAPRQLHTATLLADGGVLVAGGSRDGGFTFPPTGTERFDPETGSWAATGDLAEARYHHTATLLADGRVLALGGWNGLAVLGGAELFDPATGNWSHAGSLAVPRRNHTTTLLADGRVLVAGGGSAGDLASAELYDPATGLWSVASNLGTARSGHQAVLLANGNVLVAGGGAAYGAPSSAERYDPAGGSWSPAGGIGAAFGHSMTLLPNGKVLVAGGGTGASTLAGVALYDPATNAWSAAASLGTARRYHSATLLPSGKVLVAGGWSGSSYLTSAEIYDPATNSWSAAGGLAAARSGHSATLLADGRVLMAGGLGLSGTLTSAEILDPGHVGARRPVLASATDPLAPSGQLLLSGSGFTGDSEASSGGTSQSASNIPVVELRRLENGAISRARPAAVFSATGYATTAFANLAQGVYAVSVVVNGIPGVARLIQVRPRLPDAPTIGTAVAGNQTLSISFTPGALNGGTLLHYEANCLGAVATGSGSPIVLGGLYNGSLYTCRVRAVTSAGAGPWSADSNAVVPVAGLAEAPAVYGAVAGDRQITLAFKPGALNGGTLLRYEVNCMGALGSGDSSPIVLTGLFNGSLYACRVRTVTNVGAGPWSVLSNAVVPTVGLPAAPVIGMAVAGYQSIRLAFTPGALNGGTLLHFEANCLGAVASGGSSPIVLTGLYNGSLYTCRVRAVTSAGAGPWSADSNAVVPTLTLPDAPVIGTAVAGNQSISLGFSPGALNGGALLHHEANCMGAVASGGGSPVVLGGLYNGSLYTCRVRSVTTVGAGPWSGSSNAVIPNP